MIRHNLAEKVERPKLPRKEKQLLTREQYQRLRRTIEAEVVMLDMGLVKQASLKEGEIRWLLDVMEIAVSTGMRRTEIVNMRWSWVNFDVRQIRIRSDGDFIPKSKHERTIPVDYDTIQILRRWDERSVDERDDFVFKGVQDGQRPSEDYIGKRFKKYIRLSGLPNDLTFHSLRHTFCTWMIHAGVPVPAVRELAGHADLKKPCSTFMLRVPTRNGPFSFSAISGPKK